MRQALIIFLLLVGCSAPASANRESIQDIFGEQGTLRRVLRVEAAIAQAQAKYGIVSQKAADEIHAKAQLGHLPLEEFRAEHARVHHRMVAVLNVWKRNLSPEAANAVHFGVTTVDVYDTVLAMQMRESLHRQLRTMRYVETHLMELAAKYRDTPMMGRTLGQHAMPITFGKKLGVWAAANRRNIKRTQELLGRIDHLAILKGAVGTYAGLGDEGVQVEAQMAKQLGFSAPEPADWHGMRDVVGEYGNVQALIARTYAAMGAEIFRLQMTDIGEVFEDRGASAVGSSTMPQKRNPGKSNALLHGGRMIPALGQVLLDDVANSFERDDTSRPNRAVGEIAVLADQNTRDALILLLRLQVNPQKMRKNMDRTGGLVMSQHVVLFLSPKLGREMAEEHVRMAAAKTLDTDISFRQALVSDPKLASQLRGYLDDLLDPTKTLGLSGVEVDRVLAQLRNDRASDPDWMQR